MSAKAREVSSDGKCFVKMSPVVCQKHTMVCQNVSRSLSEAYNGLSRYLQECVRSIQWSVKMSPGGCQKHTMVCPKIFPGLKLKLHQKTCNSTVRNFFYAVVKEPIMFDAHMDNDAYCPGGRGVSCN